MSPIKFDKLKGEPSKSTFVYWLVCGQQIISDFRCPERQW